MSSGGDPVAALRREIAPSSYRTPHLFQPIIARDDVVKRLLDCDPEQVVVVCAPPAFGKTTTVALWDSADRRPFHWVQLDETDNDPVHLLRHVALATDAPELLEPNVLRALTKSGSDPYRVMLPAIVRILETLGSSVLVLDQIEALTSCDALRIVDGLLADRPSNCQLVLVGRSVHDLRLGRVAMHGARADVTVTDLAMDAQDAIDLFASSGVELRRSEADELVRRTEGWPGVIHLAQLDCSTNGVDPDRWITHPGDGPVAEFFLAEALRGANANLVEFLEQSSLVDEFDPSFLDDLLERRDSAERLDEIERSGNLFLVPTGDGQRYRYHALFAEMLRTQFCRHDAEYARRIDRRASDLLEDQGDITGAIRHAVSAGDLHRAADLVLAHTLRLANNGRSGLLRVWLDLIGRKSMDESGAAAIAWCWLGLATGDAELLKLAMPAAGQRTAEGPLTDGSTSVGVALATIRAFVAWDGIDGVIRDTTEVRASGGPDTNPWWLVATILQGSALSQSGHLDCARERFLDALKAVVDAPATQATVLAHLALVSYYEDDIAEADDLSRRAMQIMDAHELAGFVPNVAVYPIASVIAAATGRVEDALRAVAIGREGLERLDFLSPRSALQGHLLLAETALLLGDVPQAERSAKEARRVLRREPTATYLNERLEQLEERLRSATNHDGTVLVVPLTPAELRVLAHLPTHLSLREIASELTISKNTIKSHCVHIYDKLGVSSRGAAVDTSRRLGLLRQDHA